jgi:hypothetical protein
MAKNSRQKIAVTKFRAANLKGHMKQYTVKDACMFRLNMSEPNPSMRT